MNKSLASSFDKIPQKYKEKAINIGIKFIFILVHFTLAIIVLNAGVLLLESFGIISATRKEEIHNFILFIVSYPLSIFLWLSTFIYFIMALIFTIMTFSFLKNKFGRKNSENN